MPPQTSGAVGIATTDIDITTAYDRAGWRIDARQPSGQGTDGAGTCRLLADAVGSGFQNWSTLRADIAALAFAHTFR